jgi:hypothetical protein
MGKATLALVEKLIYRAPMRPMSDNPRAPLPEKRFIKRIIKTFEWKIITGKLNHWPCPCQPKIM